MKTDFVNIPKSGYNSLEPQFETKMLMVSLRTTDIIVLSTFSILQIICGLTHVQQAPENFSLLFKDPMKILRVAGLLFGAALAPRRADEGDLSKITVNREDVQIMLDLLKIRMAHCEKERDDRDPRFNPDTYIGQKLLLVDLREWLAIEQALDVTELAKDQRVKAAPAGTL